MKGNDNMIFENKILKRAEVTSTSLSFSDICKMNGLEIVECSPPHIDADVKNNAKEVLQHFNSCSDILLFIQSAVSRSCYDLKYTLHPPYTSSNLDCEYVLKKLANIKLVEDFFYSSLSKSYRIILNSSSEYSINSILCVGLCSLLDESANDITFNSCFKSEDGKFLYADLACRYDDKITLFSFEIATGLEKDVASHSEQLRKLTDKALQARAFAINRNIEKYFVVTPNCKTLLTKHDKIISVNHLLEMVSYLGK